MNYLAYRPSRVMLILFAVVTAIAARLGLVIALPGAAHASSARTAATKTATSSHSYGGFLISNAATGNSQVKALVYVDAYLPAQGETLEQLNNAKPGSRVASASVLTATTAPYPGAVNGDYDTYIKQSRFPGCFANGLPAVEAAEIAAGQWTGSTGSTSSTPASRPGRAGPSPPWSSATPTTTSSNSRPTSDRQWRRVLLARRH